MNNEVLLSVQHLSMYFGKGPYAMKAVDDVSFDIHKGEVFGLVGESGCGKTTTGRTIIRLYNATGGNVYFKGQRIVAGTKSYKDEIQKLKEEIKSLSQKQLFHEDRDHIPQFITEHPPQYFAQCRS